MEVIKWTGFITGVGLQTEQLQKRNYKVVSHREVPNGH
jgi:hypothetical protein